MGNTNIPFGYIEGDKIFLKGFLDFPDRMIGEVKESEEASIQYFVDRFEVIKKKVLDLEAAITEAENKGSYLMKLIHMRENLKQYDGLGDYPPLFESLDKLEEELKALIAVNRVRNLEIKKSLLEELTEATAIRDWDDATTKVLDIKDRWIKTGNANEPENTELQEVFTKSLTEFFDRKREFLQQKKDLEFQKIRKYQGIIWRLKQLSRNAPPDAARQLEDLKSQFSSIRTFRHRKRRQLEMDFNKVLRMVERRVQGPGQRFSKPASPLEMQENLGKKLELLRRVEKLVQEETEENMRQIKQAQYEWKQVGMIPKEMVREVNSRFYQMCETFFEKQQLERLAINKDANYEMKNNREKTRFKIVLLKDMLKRDELELQQFMENMERTNSRQNRFDKVLNSKLNNQKRKVQVKRQILQELKASLNSI